MSKKIRNSIHKRFNREPQTSLLHPNKGRGIHIGDLAGFHTSYNTDNHPKRPHPIAHQISEVNDKRQFIAPGHKNELNSHFIFRE